MRHPRIEAVVAVSSNGTIGRDQELPWRLKSDLQRFRRITMGHGLLMGRKTFDSIKKPLPGRVTFVMSRQAGLHLPDCSVVTSYQSALDSLSASQRLFIVGGAEIYRQLFPNCRVIHLTRVLADIPGDAHLEPIDLYGFRCTEQSYVPSSAHDEWPTSYQRWESTELPSNSHPYPNSREFGTSSAVSSS